jgi:DNA polymerase III delta prime subunit
MYQSKESTIVSLVKKRLAAKYDARLLISGPSGVGKSTLALDIAEQVDPRFSQEPEKAAKENVTYDALEFVRAQKNLPEKSAIVSDESAQSSHHRRFMSSENVGTSMIYIGNRYRLLVTLECVPLLALADADIIRQTHYLLVVHKRGSATVYKILQPELRGDVWWEKITDDLRFGQPKTPGLWDAYYARKVASQQALHNKLEKELEEASRPKPPTNPAIIARIVEDPDRFRDPITKKISAPLIQKEFPGLGLNRANMLRRQAEPDVNVP